MSRITTFLSISVLGLAAAASLVACSSGDVPVGTSTQKLKTTPGGNATGNGQTCSWSDAVGYDVATGTELRTPSANGEFKVGDSFPSPDGCNECSCTTSGIACTEKACANQPGGGGECPAIAQVCPDGTSVGATGPNCEFICPTPKACTEEAKQCPDGSYVTRQGPNCEFTACPSGSGVACAADAKQCPDGSYVSRIAPSCAFAPCP